ncbi:amidase family protein [Virgibacillus salinus]|uniref:Amidase n=1 Tax=Virgibacillus salinus TaxID=553311 RepID=A0A1H1FTQ6_9BACI|nr:amidase family protein [Virgibacillus salinus]SDR04108.1 amidase [Virgibacillus salinus]
MSFTLNEATISEMQNEMETGNLSAKKLTMKYLENIAKYNETVNAVLEVNPEALHIAEALDVEREQKGSRGPLHGIPILVKDNIDTGDKTHTTAGSLALENNYAKEDAFIVNKLREAGAVILGKTNLTEWANFMTDGMPNGYSSLGGQVMNPYGLGKFDVGGSSAGSGAGVAANLAAGAIGTETSGSILSPASSNSLVGIKPTVGLLSRTGIIPISNSQDTAGPMTRTVEDAATLLGALSGADAKDAATSLIKKGLTQDYSSALNMDGLNNAKLGISRDYLEGLDDEELTIINTALADLQKSGAELIDPISLPTNLNDVNVLLHEFKSGVNAYLKNLSNNFPVHSLEEVIQLNEFFGEEALKYGQTVLEQSDEKSGKLVEAEYINARLNDIQMSQEQGIDGAMYENNLDALIFANNYGAGIAAKAGYPSITVPAGYTTEGKPVGITFTGKAFTEEKLIELAYAYEQATKQRKAPMID